MAFILLNPHYRHDIVIFMKVEYKLWLKKDDKPAFGKGICVLLELVDETGSLHRAAQELKMSYRAAWGKVRDYEDRLGIDLLEKGKKGRVGASLTPHGREMVRLFGELSSRLDAALAATGIADVVSRIERLSDEDHAE